MLEPGIVRLSERVAEGIGHGEGPWGLDDPCHFGEECNRYRRNPNPFNCCLDQTDRLVAHWSEWSKKDRINFVLPEQTCHLRGALFNQGAWPDD